MEKNKLFSISQLSNLTKNTPRALRLYEKKNLLHPVFIDKETKYRFYDLNNINELNNIKKYQAIGFSLNEISDIFNGGIHSIDDQIIKIENKIVELNKFLNFLKSMSPKYTSTFYRKIVKTSKTICKNYTSLRVEDLTSTVSSDFISVLLELKIPLQLPYYRYFSSDVNLINSDSFTGTIEIAIYGDDTIIDKEFSNGVYIKDGTNYEMLCYVFRGPYYKIIDAYNKLYKYIEEKKIKVVGMLRQWYLDFFNVPSPFANREVTVEIQVPIQEIK